MTTEYLEGLCTGPQLASAGACGGGSVWVFVQFHEGICSPLRHCLGTSGGRGSWDKVEGGVGRSLTLILCCSLKQAVEPNWRLPEVQLTTGSRGHSLPVAPL